MENIIEHIISSYKKNILLETRGVGIQIWEEGIRALHGIIQWYIENKSGLSSKFQFSFTYNDIINMVNEWYNTRNINYFFGIQDIRIEVNCIKRYSNSDKNKLTYWAGVYSPDNNIYVLNIELECNQRGEINEEKFFIVLCHEFKHIYDEILSKLNGQEYEDFHKRFTYLDISKTLISDDIHFLLHFISPGEMSARLTELYYEITPDLINRNLDKIKSIKDVIKCTTIYKKYLKLSNTYEKTIDNMWRFQAKILLKRLTKQSDKYPKGRGVYNREFKDYKDLKIFLKKRTSEILLEYNKRMLRMAADKIQELGEEYNWIR